MSLNQELNQGWSSLKINSIQGQIFSAIIDFKNSPTFSISSLDVCLPVENRITLLWISALILNTVIRKTNQKSRTGWQSVDPWLWWIPLTLKRWVQMRMRLLNDMQHQWKISPLISILERFLALTLECRPLSIIKDNLSDNVTAMLVTRYVT